MNDLKSLLIHISHQREYKSPSSVCFFTTPRHRLHYKFINNTYHLYQASTTLKFQYLISEPSTTMCFETTVIYGCGCCGWAKYTCPWPADPNPENCQQGRPQPGVFYYTTALCDTHGYPWDHTLARNLGYTYAG